MSKVSTSVVATRKPGASVPLIHEQLIQELREVLKSVLHPAISGNGNAVGHSNATINGSVENHGQCDCVIGSNHGIIINLTINLPLASGGIA